MEVFTIQSYGKNRFEFILKELVDQKKGLLSFTAPESKQKYLLMVGIERFSMFAKIAI
jgi:hypothetical protein